MQKRRHETDDESEESKLGRTEVQVLGGSTARLPITFSAERAAAGEFEEGGNHDKQSGVRVAPSPARSKAALALASLFDFGGSPSLQNARNDYAQSAAQAVSGGSAANARATSGERRLIGNYSARGMALDVVEDIDESEQPGVDYSRRDKSLGLLCSNFVALYGRFPKEAMVITPPLRPSHTLYPGDF